MQANDLTISSSKADLDIEMVYAFLSQETAWAKGMPRETFDRAIAGRYVSARMSKAGRSRLPA
ncbi:hypothetical protein SAMN05192563_101117 [Paraburkholderia aspalathi]|uniref:Uncharacterized protein n=1 Tax=Paraburkholderia aspalathi TaxID=1324617 RepID=A0A1I7DQ93_9BURK|nr:hypothetical protein SAMN05192563_101117 [Paraburkholderia aspalathi]